MSTLGPILIVVGLLMLAVVVAAIVLRRSYHKVAPGKALVISRSRGEPRVSFSGALVLPVIEQAEEIDLTMKAVDVRRTGPHGLICRDGVRVDVLARFLIAVGRTGDEVLQVARTIGCERASDPETLGSLFDAKFGEALKIVAAQHDVAELLADREAFRQKVIEVIGRDLNGFVIEDLAVDALERAATGPTVVADSS